MNFRTVCCYLVFAFLFVTTAWAAEPKLTFYLPFDGDIHPQIGVGNVQGSFVQGATPQFAEGISGQGLMSGGNGQSVVFDAPGNISAEQWTITFWMKGLPNAAWNKGKYFETFWQLVGRNGGMMYFYHYMDQPTPWLYSRRNEADNYQHMYAPSVLEKEWHYWAVSWRKGSGAFLYLDGRLVGQSPCQPSDLVRYIIVGQSSNPYSPPEQNKIIDEFKIYDATLDAGAIAQQFWREGNFALRPTLTVAPTRQKIVIDGKIDTAEWRNAAGFTGLMDVQNWKMETPATRGKITYNDKNLYLAIHSDNPPEIKEHPDTTMLYGVIKKAITQHDGEVKNDDSFFFQLMPRIPDGKIYSIFVNGIDTIHDAVTNDEGKNDSSWESGVVVKSIASVDSWTLEAAIPLKSLGLERIADDTSWRVNLGRIWKMLRQRTDLWAPGQRMNDEPETPFSGLGTIHFSSQPDAVVDLQQFKIAPSGNIDASVNLYNPGTASRELNVVLTAANDTLQNQKVLLQPGKQQAVTLSALPQKADGALIGITVQNGTKVLFHQSAPFIPERVGQLALWSYPSREQIRLGWTIQTTSDPQALRLAAQIKNSSGGVVQNISLEHLTSLTGSTLADVKLLAPGQYTVDVKISEGPNVLQQQILAYDKQPLPSWLGNTLGISDTPPPPWTNVTIDQAKDAASVWGRTYDYGLRLLPEQIINQGKPMLAAPMQIKVAGGAAVSSSADAETSYAKWTETNAVRSSSQRRQTVGALALTADSYVEFDGMTWLNLTAEPQGAKAFLNGLTLEIPLKKEWAELIRPYDDYHLQQTGTLPVKGWQGAAASMPWIGNGDGGIQFFQENTASWIGSKSIEVIPGAHGMVTLRIHLVDQPVTLEKPLHFAFGWIVSPVKAAPRNYRNWRLLSSGKVVGDPEGTGPVGSYLIRSTALNPKLEAIFSWWQGWWKLPAEHKGDPDQTGVTPVPKDDLDKAAGILDYHGIEISSAAYSRLTGLVGTANPWFAQFGDEWVSSTAKFTPEMSLAPPLQSATVSQASSSLRDYYLWGFNQLLTQTKTKALYFDVSRPISDTNIYHGAGVEMPDGTIEPSRNILGMREVFKRTYTLMKQLHPDGKILYHMSGEIMLPVYSFCDAMIDGENYTGLLDRKENRGYEKILSVEQFRAEYAAQNNFGPASVFLPEFERAESITPDEWKTLGYQHADYLLGLIFLHDSNLWWAFMPVEHVAQVYGAFDATGWNSDWKFIPYWQQKYLSLPSNVYASLYQSPDGKKVVLVAMNTSGKDQEINLPATLGNSTFTSAKAVYPDRPVSLQNGKISNLPVHNNAFTVVLLEK